MNTVFVGGSRHVSRLSTQVKERLNNIISSGFQIVVGDAAGADKAVQKYLVDVSYPHVTVFCSGDHPRNNLGLWETNKVATPKHRERFSVLCGQRPGNGEKGGFRVDDLGRQKRGDGSQCVAAGACREESSAVQPCRTRRLLRSKHRMIGIHFSPAAIMGLLKDFRLRATPEEWMSVETPHSDVLKTAEPPATNVEPDVIRFQDRR